MTRRQEICVRMKPREVKYVFINFGGKRVKDLYELPLSR